MPDDPEPRLALHQADQLRTDIGNLECSHEILMRQLVRMPTRADLARTALGIIFSTAVVTTLLGLWIAAH
jgi:Flp pilus assembly CpaF family ATPase